MRKNKTGRRGGRDADSLRTAQRARSEWRRLEGDECLKKPRGAEKGSDDTDRRWQWTKKRKKKATGK